MITEAEILMDRHKEYPINREIETNLKNLLLALNAFRAIYGKPMTVSSGYRPGKYNEGIGAKKSDHMICLACDFLDLDGSLDKYCVDNINVLQECELYLEHPKWTRGWCHLQIARPRSGSRIFIPSLSNPPKELWDHSYDKLKI